ncbi:13110_t:CDS:2 [Funneliformis caledonium]|uniref:13110_t:CDS:1 n=1 Tax=Funneliformis caledonium TaxID=1117310 RepID=A0A9N9C2W2_9GLOM|nr:13110_t:CDS:2 [Funneliformis caledonium]
MKDHERQQNCETDDKLRILDNFVIKCQVHKNITDILENMKFKAVLELNISGILYADKFYNSTDDNPKVDEGGSNKDDVETSIAKEIAQMKQPHKSCRFASIQTGANCGTY